MRNILLLLLLPFLAASQTYPLANKDTLVLGTKDSVVKVQTQTIRPYNGGTIPPPDPGTSVTISIPRTTIAPKQGTGIEQWHDQNATPGVSNGDLYLRTGLEADEWYNGETFQPPSVFISYLQEAKRRGTKLSFGIMTFNGTARIPAFVWNKMDKWTYQGRLIPNWNDPIYLAWVADHCKKINAWIYANGWQDQIGAIDIRHYGSWGEWNIVDITNNYKLVPAGKHLTEASGITIVKAYVEAFPNFQLVTMLATHDKQRLPNVWVAPGISVYALAASNAYGKLGYRWDAIGSGDQYPKDWINNADPNRWKVAPVNGEPIGNTSYMGSIVTDVTGQHVNALGNGNPGSYPSNVQALYRTASAAMGFRLTASGTIVGTTNALQVNMQLLSDGLVPMYEKYSLVYDFGDAGTVTSSWSPRLFMGTFNLVGSLKPPAGWTTLTLRLVCPGRPSLLNLKVR